MDTTERRDEAMHLAAVIAADRAQLDTLDRAIGQLYDARSEVVQRVWDNEARWRSLTADHYAEFAEQAKAWKGASS